MNYWVDRVRCCSKGANCRTFYSCEYFSVCVNITLLAAKSYCNATIIALEKIEFIKQMLIFCDNLVQ